MRILITLFCLSLLILPVQGFTQDVLSIKGRRAIVTYNSASHIIQIGQEYSTIRTPGATIQIQEIGERFILANLVEGRLREDDQIDFSSAMRLMDEDKPAYRPHHVSLGYARSEFSAIGDEQGDIFSASSVSGISFSYRFERENATDYGFSITSQKGFSEFGEEMVDALNEVDERYTFINQEFDLKHLSVGVTMRRFISSWFIFDAKLAYTAMTYTGPLKLQDGPETMTAWKLKGLQSSANLGFYYKIKNRVFLEALAGVSISLLNSFKFQELDNTESENIEAGALAYSLNTVFNIGFSF
jgi:hypothetical protein